MRKKHKKLILMLIWQFMFSLSALAGQNNNHITLSIELAFNDVELKDVSDQNDNIPFRQPLLIFADATFVGIVPGAVGVDLRPEGVIVEIGLSNLRDAPFYSFTLNTENLEEGRVNVKYSTFVRSEMLIDKVGTRIYYLLTGTDVITAEIVRENNFLYRLILDASFYEEILIGYMIKTDGYVEQVNNSEKIVFKTTEDYYASFNQSVTDLRHDMYVVDAVGKSVSSKQLVNLLETGQISWSGNYVNLGLGIDTSKKMETWWLSSDPEEAEVILSLCDLRYRTITTEYIRSDCIDTMVIVRDGFEQCVFNKDLVSEENGIKKFHCDLVEIMKN